VRLLGDVRSVFGDAEHMTSAAILDALHKMEESPWVDIRGKPLDARGLAKRLREFDVKPMTIRVGTATPRGYTRADLWDAWSRYLPSRQKSATPETGATSPDLRGENVAEHPPSSTTLSATFNPRQQGLVACVARVADFPGDGRGPRTCAQCGVDDGRTAAVSMDGHDVWLHRECEQAFISTKH
jgi:hypothetical protein